MDDASADLIPRFQIQDIADLVDLATDNDGERVKVGTSSDPHIVRSLYCEELRNNAAIIQTSVSARRLAKPLVMSSRFHLHQQLQILTRFFRIIWPTYHRSKLRNGRQDALVECRQC